MTGESYIHYIVAKGLDFIFAAGPLAGCITEASSLYARLLLFVTIDHARHAVNISGSACDNSNAIYIIMFT